MTNDAKPRSRLHEGFAPWIESKAIQDYLSGLIAYFVVRFSSFEIRSIH